MKMKTFRDVDVSPKSIYIKVKDEEGATVIVKKVTLVYLFSEKVTNNCKFGIARLLRVQAPDNLSCRRKCYQDVDHSSREAKISEGDRCAFASADGKSFLKRTRVIVR